MLLVALALLTGRLIAVDDRPVAGVRVIIQWGSASAVYVPRDTLAVDSLGNFAALERSVDADSVTILVDPVDQSRYHAAKLVVSRARMPDTVHILLIPKQWTIARGRFTGRSVPISPASALRHAPGRGSFGRVNVQRVVGWVPNSFPLGVVLRRDDGARIAPGDSVAFWDSAR